MINIYLADLANDTFEIDNKSIPIGVGYVGAYCKKIFGNKVNIRVYRTLKPLLTMIEQQSPDVVGFGCYDWNYNLSRKAAFLIKEKFQQSMVVFGGANIAHTPKDNREFLQKNPYIDFLVYGDGELAFSNLIKLFFQFKNEKDSVEKIKQLPLDGVRSLSGENLIMGQPIDHVIDLSVLPSPYLSGLFDDLLNNSLLMPIIQNVRGCPYKCSFCVSGSQSDKIRSFPFDQVRKEIDYLRGKSENRVLRFSDDNFGIVEGDLKVAEYLRDSNEKHNYPSGIKLYLSKKLNQRTREISKILKKMTLMNISFQSITPDVLKNSKRINFSFEEVEKNMDFARKNEIATGTELIFGLPGESIDSMKEVIDTVLKFRFDSIGLGVLWLLKGAELGTPEMRGKYQYQSKFMLGENAITYTRDFLTIEYDEVAVASKYFTFEDFKYFIRFNFIFLFAIYFGYARELLYHASNFNIKPSDIFQKMIVDSEKYQLISNMSREYADRYLENMFESEEQLYDFVQSNIDNWIDGKADVTTMNKTRNIYDFLSKLLFDDPSFAVFDEFSNAINSLYEGDHPGEFSKLTENLKELSIKLIVNPKTEFKDEILFSSKYNLRQWVADGYTKTISNYSFTNSEISRVKLRNPEIVKYLMNKNKSESKESCFNFFRYTNSSERRRVFVKSIP